MLAQHFYSNSPLLPQKDTHFGNGISLWVILVKKKKGMYAMEETFWNFSFVSEFVSVYIKWYKMM